MNDDKVDLTEFLKMVDIFIENGFNYFDTAHGYLDGKSEIAIKNCLTSPENDLLPVVSADDTAVYKKTVYPKLKWVHRFVLIRKNIDIFPYFSTVSEANSSSQEQET